MHPIPLSLYIHIPWCVQKCPYCDFNSHQKPKELPEQAYIDRLLRELVSKQALIQGRPIQTIFFGGGTPSLFAPESYVYLFEQLRQHITLRPGAEITLEANPGTVEQKRFEGFLKAGINRLSIGIQSFQDDKLKILGRIHSANEAKKAIFSAKTAGFTNFNLDLMFGLPHQSVSDGLFDLETALSFEPPHLSWYHLTLEPNTPFFKMPPPLPADETIWELQEQGQAFLKAHGYEHYEISAFARGQRYAKHNLNYWQFGDYLGLGAGAHSKITLLEPFRILRQANVAQPSRYLQTTSVDKEHLVPKTDIPLEFFMNAFRLMRQIDWKTFETRTQLSKETVLPTLQKIAEKNWVVFDDQTIHITPSGSQFLNELLQEWIQN